MMISLIELAITAKDVYKAGTEHAVYKDHKDPNKIYKVVKPDHKDVSKQAYNWVKVFRDNPKYFPIVYKATERGASLEKLDTSKAQKEFEAINDYIRPLFKLERYWFEALLKDIAEGDNPKDLITQVGTKLQEDKPELAVAFKRFITLMFKLQSINNPDYTLDAHAGNFGYDKKGNLKMLDV